MGWNRGAERHVERVQLETMDAGVYVRRWLTGDRLEYQDRSLTEGSEMDVDEDGMKFRRFIPSAISRLSIELSVVDVDGDLVQDGEKFDPRNPDHVNSLDPETFDEILRICQETNPTTGAIRKPQDRKPAAGEGDAQDPSRTQPTAREGSEASPA